jgi:ParB/RepB/Spo0J family partition protein
MQPVSNTITLLPWTDIAPSPLNALVRGGSVTVENDEEIKELAASILAVGIVQPLVVKETSENGQYELVVGERRWCAARYLGEQAPLLPCRVYPAMAELDQLIFMGIENLHRRGISPITEAKYYQNLLQRGMSLNKLLQRLNLDRHRVIDRLRLLKLHPDVQELIHTQSFPLSAAKHLRGLPAEVQVEVARKMTGRPVRDIARVVGLVKKELETSPAGSGVSEEITKEERTATRLSYKTQVKELKELLAKMAAQIQVTGQLLAECALSLEEFDPDLAVRAGARAQAIEDAIQKHVAARKEKAQ